MGGGEGEGVGVLQALAERRIGGEQEEAGGVDREVVRDGVMK